MATVLKPEFRGETPVKTNHKYLYGPVHSWRLGRSLGIDPLSGASKICNMDCVYCQLGPTMKMATQRQFFIPTRDLLNEIASLDPTETFDWLTISGRGEPTLARNLGEIIDGIRQIRKEKIAVITNSSLLHRDDVRQDLLRADMVMAKLDAPTEGSFQEVDKPADGVTFSDLTQGLFQFRKMFKGLFSLDLMIVESNKHLGKSMAAIAELLEPDVVHLNTPMRDCPVQPLSVEDILKVREHFVRMPVTTVYDKEFKQLFISDKSVVLRHGRDRLVKGE